ncbi:hypothetical protein BHE90_015443 [Fusarium euwallaceae]|uniref:Uncharacterized protein n=1 Tax=Fusarium euwallaceae TaxID=1147111 RepID=A0A430L334_9HYPO|nr:hypothetical protein BHE90_015443 [Fusarium euwallaceae]
MKPNFLLPVLAAAGIDALPLSSTTASDESTFGMCFSNSECSGSTPICYDYTSTCVGCIASGDINSTEEPLDELTEEPVDETPEQLMDEPMEEPEDDDLELPLGEPHPILDDTDTGSDVSLPTSDGDLPSPDRPLTPDL